ncbi:MAG: hypothetical protein IPL84_14000 [Chitinophagaceae bacterium]|nr:hypothetical protein [Chitinophagaceae bacterium]
MNNKLLIVKFIFLFAFFSSSVISQAGAQNNGILPLTGLKYFNEGLASKGIEVKVDGSMLISNRVPLNKEIEISFKQLNGFVESSNKTMYAGAEVVVLSPRGDVLFKDPNVLLRSKSNGFYANDLKDFSIKFGIGADLIKGNFNGMLIIKLFDMKGKSQIRLEFPATFARPGERLQVSKNTKLIKSNVEANGVINGLQVKGMKVDTDTSIKVAPRMAYTSVDISNIEGSSLAEIFQGKERFWVYDSKLNEVKITDILLKQVKGALENNTVNCMVKIPYRLKSNLKELYTVRYRWESLDKSQVIDVVVTN